MQSEEAALERKARRRLHRIQVAADRTLSDRIRIAAVKAIQARLEEGNPLKDRKPGELLKTMKQPEQMKYPGQPVTVADLW